MSHRTSQPPRAATWSTPDNEDQRGQVGVIPQDIPQVSSHRVKLLRRTEIMTL